MYFEQKILFFLRRYRPTLAVLCRCHPLLSLSFVKAVLCRGCLLLRPSSVMSRLSFIEVFLHWGHHSLRSSSASIEVVLCRGCPLSRSSCVEVLLCWSPPLSRSSSVEIHLCQGPPLSRLASVEVVFCPLSSPFVAQYLKLFETSWIPLIYKAMHKFSYFWNFYSFIIYIPIIFHEYLGLALTALVLIMNAVYFENIGSNLWAKSFVVNYCLHQWQLSLLNH